MMNKGNIHKVLSILAEDYPETRSELHFETPFQLLVATILSAQCTDKRVNLVTEGLFKKWSTAADFAALSSKKLEEEIKSCGLYQMKARHIIEASRRIIDDFGGGVPNSMEDLLELPGVGRKTANVILANAFNRDALAVDTHVFRVAHRLGWSTSKTPEKTETDLKQIIPSNLWSNAHHWFIQHGRRICAARKPRCPECRIKEFCRFNPAIK